LAKASAGTRFRANSCVVVTAGTSDVPTLGASDMVAPGNALCDEPANATLSYGLAGRGAPRRFASCEHATRGCKKTSADSGVLRPARRVLAL
jgi:hypothetical protein